MSREIKFRILDKKSKSFITRPENLLLGNKYYIDCSGNIIIRDTIDFLHETNKDNYELMQYTGIKDKNGVEIYEGDIVLIRIDKTNILHKTVVKFKHGAFIADIIGDNDYIYLFHFGFNKDDFEVIGNIYENKNLLEGNNG